MSRILRLTLLAPDIVETLPVGQQVPEMTLPMLMTVVPADWSEQGWLNRCSLT